MPSAVGDMNAGGIELSRGGGMCAGLFSHHQSREQIGEPVGGYQNAYISSKAYEVDVVFSGGDPRTHLFIYLF